VFFDAFVALLRTFDVIAHLRVCVSNVFQTVRIDFYSPLALSCDGCESSFDLSTAFEIAFDV